ncbi:MAG: type II toxin-antitoxin system prevent-host-death family antitoxin [Sphingosinicella sp.]
MGVATAVEVQKRFGRFRALAHREPVMITSHGREDVVLLSAEEYKRLKQRDRQVLLTSELDAGDLAALAMTRIPGEAAAFDHEIES